jgi:hypothetical protein
MSTDIFVFQKIVVPGNATTTVNNIMAGELLFRIGICGFLGVIILDVLVAWALYIFLKPVNKSLSLLAGWLRLAYSIIFGVALVNYFGVLQLLSNAEYLNIFGFDQLKAQVMLSLNAFGDGWAVGFVFFGLHLTIIGYLIFKSDTIPRILGVLLILAGGSYLIDYFGKFLNPEYDLNIATFMGWGELIFMFWLLLRGRKMKQSAQPL